VPPSDPVELTQDEAGFTRALDALSNAHTYFIDTEFESSRKQTRLSVIQVSAGEEIFLLDALVLQGLERLGDVLLRDEAVWVLHAGLQDVELLLEAFRKPKPPTLFDTQVAWALLGPETSVSLAYLQYRILGVRSMKTHQADDWLRRPLPPSQLAYAASDIKYLPAIHQNLVARLEALDRTAVVSPACRELLWPKPELPGPLELSSFRNAWQLEPMNQAILRYLIEWFNALPEFERDRAPQGKALLSIASRAPTTAKDLFRIKGVPPQLGRGHAETLARGISQVLKSQDEGEFQQIEPAPYATFEEIELDGWLHFMRAWVSSRASVAPELALPGRIMRSLRQTALEKDRTAALAQIDGWRQALLGAALDEFASKYL
jgi:ribonuclease D